MIKAGLVLEGGGMRGLYSTGVLDFFMEKGLYFPYVIGVSAGACHGASYISKQQGRGKDVNIDYLDHPEYLGYKNLITGKGLFGMDFIFDKIPNKLNPYDYDACYENESKFIIGASNCETGEAIYYDKDSLNKEELLTVIRASSSLPFLAPIVDFKGDKLLDGGISDPIPIRKSIKDGYKKNVIILTRNLTYRKTPFKGKWIAKLLYKSYPGIVDALLNRYQLYNQTLDYIEKLEEKGQVFVIRPKQELQVKRIEKDANKLVDLYNQGYQEAKNSYKEITDYLKIK
ncbi:patatin-like phospholipase family protein [Orenia marismortui]|uniref:patatin-like phospholipase family protein n=1 Tax=Orenia marismortui TaxID=46469 RepID=UPI00037E9BEB|nr:patatin family protein [Orenia marismortui]